MEKQYSNLENNNEYDLKKKEDIINLLWNAQLNELKYFIENNHRYPSHSSKLEKEKILASWVKRQ